MTDFHIGQRVKVIGQCITGTVVRYDGAKLVVLDDDRHEWADVDRTSGEGEEGVLIYRDYELEGSDD
jgi:hypothetical protein